MKIDKYIEMRIKMVEGTLASEILAGNNWKIACERSALAELIGVEAALRENKESPDSGEAPTTNTVSNEIRSNDVCDYCTHGVGHCTEPCRGCSSFIGRKLRA